MPVHVVCFLSSVSGSSRFNNYFLFLVLVFYRHFREDLFVLVLYIVFRISRIIIIRIFNGNKKCNNYILPIYILLNYNINVIFSKYFYLSLIFSKQTKLCFPELLLEETHLKFLRKNNFRVLQSSR